MGHASLYALLFSKFGMTFELVIYGFFITMMSLIALIDFKTQDVYTAITLFTGSVGILFIIIQTLMTKQFPLDLLMGAGIGFIGIGLIVWLTGGMGEGDIEIAALIGLFLGSKLVLLSLFFSFILGGIAGAILLATGSSKKDEMAFGPYLALGAFISLYIGQELLTLYMNYLIY